MALQKAKQHPNADIVTEAEGNASYAPINHNAGAGAPGSPATGWLWYNTSTLKLNVRNPSAG